MRPQLGVEHSYVKRMHTTFQAYDAELTKLLKQPDSPGMPADAVLRHALRGHTLATERTASAPASVFDIG